MSLSPSVDIFVPEPSPFSLLFFALVWVDGFSRGRACGSARVYPDMEQTHGARSIDRAIILAAGFGSRLIGMEDPPKALARVGGRPLLLQIVENLASVGVEECVIVVGHKGAQIVEALERHRVRAAIRFVRNPRFDLPNGNSLLAARDYIEGRTLLTMADHLCDPSIYKSVIEHPAGASEAVLAVDRRIDACFDLEDATKLVVKDGLITAIGKELREFNAIDTGVFCVVPELIHALESLDGEMGDEGVSLSEGVSILADEGRFHAAEIDARARWIDVDTPAARRRAEELFTAAPPGFALA